MCSSDLWQLRETAGPLSGPDPDGPPGSARPTSGSVQSREENRPHTGVEADQAAQTETGPQGEPGQAKGPKTKGGEDSGGREN